MTNSYKHELKMDWLKLKLIPNLGSVGFTRLLARFGSPSNIFAAPFALLSEVKGIGEPIARAICQQAFIGPPEDHVAAMERMNARMVTMIDDEYPPLLRHIHAPPPVLFVQGDLWPCHATAVAIVGSRKPTIYGQRVAEKLAQDLAQAKVPVISGLARGIDSMAHRSVLQAGGYTVGVMACGLDYPYPPENAGLIKEVGQSGAVISEFLIDAPPRPGLFPIRNRIIAGLSRAVVVVEASLKSGSLITARHALDQGREIFAVPGPVSSHTSMGCHELLKQGAGLLSGIEELYESGVIAHPNPAMSLVSQKIPLAAQMRQSNERAGLTLPQESQIILDLLGMESTHIDDIIRMSGLAPQTVTALLVDLELEGLVDRAAGHHYTKL